MEPYNPNKPFVQMKLEGNLLDRLAEAGIPLSRALKYFRDNPEGSAGETFRLAVEDADPTGFYSTYRNNGGALDYLSDAALWLTPLKGPRRMVRKYPDGSFNNLDIGTWNAQKEAQLNRIKHELYKRDPMANVPSIESEINSKLSNIEAYRNIADNPTFPKWQREDAEKRIKGWQDEIAKLQNDITERTINSIDYKGMPYDKFVENYSKRNVFTDRPIFIDRALDNEGIKYKADVLDDGYNAYMSNGHKPPEY